VPRGMRGASDRGYRNYTSLSTFPRSSFFVGLLRAAADESLSTPLHHHVGASFFTSSHESKYLRR
jgi:hypothetical protein